MRPSTHEDGFQVDLTLLRPMGTGSGRDKNLSPGRMGYTMSRKLKKSIVKIRNSDELCCARAIVTMKAWCHRNDRHHMPRNEWKNLRDGYPLQGTLARQLHQGGEEVWGPEHTKELWEPCDTEEVLFDFRLVPIGRRRRWRDTDTMERTCAECGK